MTPMRHALLARMLIKECGGLEEAGRIGRLNKSRLAHFQDPNSGAFMPIDAIAELEAYCGVPIYSREVASARPSADSAESLREEACNMVERATEVLATIRQADADGVRTAGERRAIQRALIALSDQLRTLMAAGDKEDGGAR